MAKQLTKTMIQGSIMGFELHSVGYYTSPQGGAPAPASIGEASILFELITVGSVYAPSGERCEAGWVFAHQAGEKTIWNSDPTDHYECLTVRYLLPQAAPRDAYIFWPRFFYWEDIQGALHFSHEMLYAFHQGEADRDILGNYIWNTLHFRLDQYLRKEVPQAVPPRMQRIVQYLNSYFAQDVSVEELANLVNLSPSHVHAQFKQSFSMSPHQYLIRERMRVACHQLVSSASSIQHIAKEVGYKNTETFCRTFKQQFGSTAAQYRKRYTLHAIF